MGKDKIDIWTYAHWKGFVKSKLIGILSAHQGKGRKAFSFEYDKEWLESYDFLLLDPDIQYFSGPRYPSDKINFGVFVDSMPDTWGRTLMKRKNDNNLDFELARSVGEYFQLDVKAMDTIINQTKEVIRNWDEIAEKIGVSRHERAMMAPAFAKVF